MLLISNSISNTKKFFQRTIDTFKSLLSKGTNTYEKLPKTPSFHPFSCGRNDTTNNNIETGYQDLDNFYTEFTNHWNSHKSKAKNKSGKKTVFTTTKQSSQKLCTDQIEIPQNRNCQFAARTEEEESLVPIITTYTENNAERRSDDDEIVKSKSSEVTNDQLKEKRLSCVAHKLKELELMDMGNVDHKVDVQQVLHYYSRLTCPPYLDIVDKFFMEMCAEFFPRTETGMST